MKPISGYELVTEAGETRNLPAGCYAIRIIDVTDDPVNERLRIVFDIAEGEFKGYYATIKSVTGKDVGSVVRSYKLAALPFFKAMITAIEKSNPGYQWNWDEKSLIGKFAAGEFGEEEFNINGEIKTYVNLQNFRSLQALREGKCKVPELKKLPDSMRPVKPEDLQVEAARQVSESELPF